MKYLIIIILLFSITCGYAKDIEPWVLELDNEGSLQDRILLRDVQISFNPEKEKTIIENKYIYLIGGIGHTTDFSHVDYVYGKKNIKFKKGIIRYPDGKEDKFPKNAYTLNNTFEAYVLYSDYYKAQWYLNNIPVGSIAQIEYTIELDLFKNHGAIYLEDVLAMDSTVVSFEFPEDYEIEFDTNKTGEIKVEYSSKSFRVSSVDNWTSEKYDGGMARSAARLHYYLKKLENNPGWPEVNAEVTEWFEKVPKKCKEHFPVAWTLEQCMEDFEDKYRYVAVEIGKGSHIPHKPATVIKNKYGDCKDLSTAFAAMFTNPEYTVFKALVSTRKREFFADKPSPYQFNHVIVVLLNSDGDTLYYDPTAEGYRPDNLPWGIQGCPVLILDGESSLKFIPEDSAPILTKYKLNCEVGADGVMRGDFDIIMDARVAGDKLNVTGPKAIKEFFREAVNGKYYIDCGEVSYNEHESLITAKVTIKNATKKLGKNYLLSPFILDGFNYDVLEDEPLDGLFFIRQRTYNFETSLSFTNSVTVKKQSDSLINECGHTFYNIKCDGNSMFATWEYSRYKNFYSIAEKDELNQLFTRLKKHIGLRVKL